jgi:hypothetical protein
MLTSAAQCTAKLESAQSINLALCQRIRNADSLQHNALQKERWNQQEQTLASVSEDQNADSSAHIAKLESAQNKDWHLSEDQE